MTGPAVRVASLLPAATEIVAVLGQAHRLVAVTYECDQPAGIRAQVPVVVDTVLPSAATPGEIDALVRARAAAGLPLYELDRELLRAAAPDLVLTQDLCGVCALPATSLSEALQALGLHSRVLTLDPHSLDDVLGTIHAVGAGLGVPGPAAALVAGLRTRLARVARQVAHARRPRVLVLEWVDPPYVAGHWVPELVERAGGEAVRGRPGARSVPAAWDALVAARPEVVLVAPCGYGLDDAVAQAARVREHFPGVPLVAVDSDAYVVRAGPRLVDGVEALAWALHPDAVPAPPPGRVARLA